MTVLETPKAIMIMLDGVGDTCISYRETTPLKLANTPNLDYIASIGWFTLGLGLNGLLDPVEPGLACGSDTAHLSILGYNPYMYKYIYLLWVIIREEEASKLWVQGSKWILGI